MKTNAIIRIIAYSLAILLLLGILISRVFLGIYFESGRIRSHLNDDRSYPTEGLITQHQFTEEINNIEIDWVSGNIVILPSDTVNGIHVSEYMGRDVTETMVCKQSGQTLKIQFCEDSIEFPSFGINVNYSKDLEIRVPAHWICNSLEIDTASAEVEIENLTIKEFDFDGASGGLFLKDCNLDVLDVDTASGDVEFTGTLKELDYDAASAKFYGEFRQNPDKLNLDAMSGDLELVLPPSCGFYLELDTMSGSFDSDFDFHTTGEHYECGDGACKIKVSAMSGDVSILKGISNN